MNPQDSHYRLELCSSLSHLMGLNFDSSCKLLKEFNGIESNRELINSLPEILESYF